MTATQPPLLNTTEHDAFFRRLANALIPAKPVSRLPGAGEDPAFSRAINKMEGKSELQSVDLDQTIKDLHEADDNEFALAIASIANANPTWFRLFSHSIVQAYYSDPHVLSALGLSNLPRFPRGHSLAPDDWSILEPVRRMKKIYRSPS